MDRDADAGRAAGDVARPVAPRCLAHHLAVGQDGRCVLCRRGAGRERLDSWGRWGGWVAMLAITGWAAVKIGGLFGRLEEPSLGPSRPTTAVHRPLDAAPRLAPAAAAPPAAVHAPRVEVAADAATATRAPGGATATRAPGAPPDLAVSLAPTRLAREPDEAELLSAVRRVPVTFYMASWCPHCRRAQAWMQANQLTVVEHDIESDPRAKETNWKLNGGRGRSRTAFTRASVRPGSGGPSSRRRRSPGHGAQRGQQQGRGSRSRLRQ